MKKIKLKKINLVWLLILAAPFFIVSLFILNFSQEVKVEILYLAALFYVVISLLHHHTEKTLNLETIIEYILIAVLALVILQGLIV